MQAEGSSGCGRTQKIKSSLVGAGAGGKFKNLEALEMNAFSLLLSL